MLGRAGVVPGGVLVPCFRHAARPLQVVRFERDWRAVPGDRLARQGRCPARRHARTRGQSHPLWGRAEGGPHRLRRAPRRSHPRGLAGERHALWPAVPPRVPARPERCSPHERRPRGVPAHGPDGAPDPAHAGAGLHAGPRMGADCRPRGAHPLPSAPLPRPGGGPTALLEWRHPGAAARLPVAGHGARAVPPRAGPAAHHRGALAGPVRRHRRPGTARGPARLPRGPALPGSPPAHRDG